MRVWCCFFKKVQDVFCEKSYFWCPFFLKRGGALFVKKRLFAAAVMTFSIVIVVVIAVVTVSVTAAIMS
jgi:hypothetical protein